MEAAALDNSAGTDTPPAQDLAADAPLDETAPLDTTVPDGATPDTAVHDGISDPGSDPGQDVPAPVCLYPVLPDSCLKEALECTGLSTCGPTVTDCFQYGSIDFPQASWLVSELITSQSLWSPTFSASNDVMRIDFSNGARMIGEFLPRPRALYYSPADELCAVLDFHYEENSNNWGDYQVMRRYYLRYGDDKLIVIHPRFLTSPRAWWQLEGFDVLCDGGQVEEYSFEEFKPLAYLLFGGENRLGKSFLPFWTSDGCELGEFDYECLQPEDVGKREWCEGTDLHVCSRGASLVKDCASKQKACAQIPVKYGGEIAYYHSFCTNLSCSEDGCDGDRIVDCWGGSAEVKDCSMIGGTCFLKTGYPPYTKTEAMCAQSPAKPCQQTDFLMHCDGSTAVSCAYYGYEYRLDCSRVGMTCVEYTGGDGKQWASCHPASSPKKCTKPDAGCDGNMRNACQGGWLIQEDCAARFNKTCKTGDKGAPMCVEPASTPCTGSPANCVDCVGDRRVFCHGGLTVFDDCSMQGLAPTQGEGRTCYAGAGPDLVSSCPYCGQKGAEACDLNAFTPYCADNNMVKCFGDHAIEFDCIEVFPKYVSGWCNINQWGSAYCESSDAPPCDPETTPSQCEGPPPVAVNCTQAGVFEKTNCLDQGLVECKLNAEGDAVCVQPGAKTCDQATAKPWCEGASLVTCPSGFTVTTPCGVGMACSENLDGMSVCHQTGADTCDEYMFDYRCEGEVAVSCLNGFVHEIDCPAACSGCICKSGDWQAWCEPGMP